MSTVIALASGQGGAGKTTFAVNLGYTFASAGARTLLIDFNMGLRNDDIYLGLEDKSVFDIGDVVSGVCRLEKAVTKHDSSSRLSLLSCPQYKSIEGFGPEHVKVLCNTLSKDFDYIFLDLPAGLSELSLAACADKALIIVTPDYVSVRNGDTVDQKLESMGIMRRYYAVNRVKQSYANSDCVPGSEYISKVFKTPLVGIVPEDDSIHFANNSGMPVCTDADSYISRNFAEIATRLIK